jgi:hypothetical protein
VAPGYDRYGSGLRDRSADFERSWKLTSIAASAAPFACQLAVGLLHERLLAEASVPSLRHEQAARCPGTPSVVTSATRLSKIDFGQSR